jgi:hypothetical protein
MTDVVTAEVQKFLDALKKLPYAQRLKVRLDLKRKIALQPKDKK